jgi:hypothetical protein
MSERKRKPRQLKSRSRESVERKFDNRQSQFARRGVYFINSALDDAMLVRSAVWEGGKFVLRIWPLLDPERPTEALMSGRTSPYDTAGQQGMALSELVPTVSYAGITDKIAASLRIRSQKQYDPCSYIIARSTSDTVEGVPYSNLPYPLIQSTFRAASRAADYGEAKNGQFDSRWLGLFPREHGPKEIAMPNIKNVSFAVCSVVENGEEFNLHSQRVKVYEEGHERVKQIPREGVPLGERDSDPLVVVELSASAARAIWKICNVPNEDYQGDAEISPAKAFKYGDPTGIFDPKTEEMRGGLFFTIYNPDYGSIANHTTEVPKAKPAKDKGKSAGFGSYECAVSRSYGFRNYKISASRTRQQVDRILERQVFLWPVGDEAPGDRSYLLHVPTIEEQALLLAKAIKPFPQAAMFLRYCWSSAPEYLQFDSVRSVLSNRVSTVVDGGRDEQRQSAEPRSEGARQRLRDARHDDDRRDPAESRRPAPKQPPAARQRPARAPEPPATEFDDFDDPAVDQYFVPELDEQLDAPPAKPKARNAEREFDTQFDDEELDAEFDEDDSDDLDDLDDADDADDLDGSDDFGDEFDEEDSDEAFDEDDSDDEVEAVKVEPAAADDEFGDEDDFDEPAAVGGGGDISDDQAAILAELGVEVDDWQDEDIAGDMDVPEADAETEVPPRTPSENAAIKRSRK